MTQNPQCPASVCAFLKVTFTVLIAQLQWPIPDQKSTLLEMYRPESTCTIPPLTTTCAGIVVQPTVLGLDEKDRMLCVHTETQCTALKAEGLGFPYFQSLGGYRPL